MNHVYLNQRLRLPTTRLCRVIYHRGEGKARVKQQAIIETPSSNAMFEVKMLQRGVGANQIQSVSAVYN